MKGRVKENLSFQGQRRMNNIKANSNKQNPQNSNFKKKATSLNLIYISEQINTQYIKDFEYFEDPEDKRCLEYADLIPAPAEWIITIPQFQGICVFSGLLRKWVMNCWTYIHGSKALINIK